MLTNDKNSYKGSGHATTIMVFFLLVYSSKKTQIATKI